MTFYSFCVRVNINVCDNSLVFELFSIRFSIRDRAIINRELVGVSLIKSLNLEIVHGCWLLMMILDNLKIWQTPRYFDRWPSSGNRGSGGDSPQCQETEGQEVTHPVFVIFSGCRVSSSTINIHARFPNLKISSKA
jgi:hypothetical protein